jgi:hypothetical protein
VSAPIAAMKKMIAVNGWIVAARNTVAGYSPSRRSGVRSIGSASSISLVNTRSDRV